MRLNQIVKYEYMKSNRKNTQYQKAKNIVTKEYLIEHLINQKKSMQKVANEIEVDLHVISKIAKEFGVINKHSLALSKKDHNDSIITKEYIQIEYIEKQRTIKEIAEELNIDPSSLITRIKTLGFKVQQCIRLTKEQKLNLRWDNLIPLEKHVKDKGHDSYLFQCSCGKQAIILWQDVMTGKRETCGKCDWYEDINKSYWGSVVKGAKSRNLEFSITKKYVWDIYLKQNRKCIYTGFDIKFGYGGKSTASIDRIDNNKGYIIGNIQITHKSINLMRGSTETELFKYLCAMVTENSKVDKEQFKNKAIIQVKNTTTISS